MSLQGENVATELADLVQDVEARLLPLAGCDIGVAIFVWDRAGWRFASNDDPDEASENVSGFLAKSGDATTKRLRRRTAQ